MDQVKVKQDDFTLCPKFTETFAMLGKKWNGLIIEVLLHEHTQRFTQYLSWRESGRLFAD